LGAGRPYVARLAVLVSMLMVNVEGISAALALLLGHNFWGYCYSNKEEVVKSVGQVLLLVALSHFVDGMQSVLSGKFFSPKNSPVVVANIRCCMFLFRD